MHAAVDGDIPSALNDLVDGPRTSARPSLSACLEEYSNSSILAQTIDRLRELASSVLVCKFWQELNSKEASRAAIAKAQTAKHYSRMETLRLAASNPQVRWLDRLCAMAATNDVTGLREHFGERLAYSEDEQVITASARPGLFAATKELELYEARGVDLFSSMYFEYDRDPIAENTADEMSSGEVIGGPMGEEPGNLLPSSGLFLNVEEASTWGVDGDCCEILLAFVCAVNAACGGSTEAVAFFHGWISSWSLYYDLWNIRSSYRRFAPGLVLAVEYSCRNKYLDAPVQGIAALLSGADLYDHAASFWFSRVRGSNGTVMHLAAAANNKKLVEALICEEGDSTFPNFAVPDALDSEEIEGYNSYISFSPAQWASNRGYFELSELLNGGMSDFD
jgi:hypothetical protein